ncbi:MAG: antitoxin Xre/MbcA/ParS toxin-binding domain-containing protein [Parvibaculaceae bacterium]
MSAQLDALADVLGLPLRAGDGYLRLADEMEHGLPAKALDRLAGLLAPGDATFKYRVVPKATLSRSKGKRLSQAHSERIGRYARIWAAALRVWKSEEEARAFLWRGNPLLEGRRPIEVATTEVGARLVEDILGGLEYGTAI